MKKQTKRQFLKDVRQYLKNISWSGTVLDEKVAESIEESISAMLDDLGVSTPEIVRLLKKYPRLGAKLSGMVVKSYVTHLRSLFK